MPRTTPEKDTAALLGLTVKTLNRYRKRAVPCPHDVVNGRLFYDPEEVRAYMASQGLSGGNGRPILPPADAAPEPAPPAAPAPSGPVVPADYVPTPKPPPVVDPALAAIAANSGAAALTDATDRQNLRKADLATKALRAEKAKMEVAAIKGLADLGLDVMLRDASTLDALADVTTEVMALMAAGRLPPAHGAKILDAISEKRQILKLQAREKAAEAKSSVVVPGAILCRQGTTEELVRMFENILSTERQERIVRFVSAIFEEDKLDSPAADTGEPTDAEDA